MTRPTALREPSSTLRRVASAAGLTLVFLASVVLSVIGHLQTPVGRALVTDGINTALRDVFWGTVRVEGIDHIGIKVIRVSGASVLDERGDRLIHLSDVRVYLTLPQLIGSLLPSVGERVLELPPIRAELAEVMLSNDAQYGGVTLARALTPRPAPATSSSARKASPMTVLLPSIELGRVAGRFKIPILDVLLPELAAVHGSVQVSDAGVLVDVKRFGVIVGGLAAPMRGTATVQINAPKSVEV
jgi:hypothetical protein